MRKLLAIGLCLVMCFSFSACGDNENNNELGSQIDSHTNSEISNQEYTYTVRAMQGVETCIYYGPDAYVPNSPNPEGSRNKIHVWTKCITCGDDGESYHIKIPVEELDFSNGDTIQYTGTDSCWDCSWDRQIASFMWAVEITRVAKE